ncbi:MAG: protein translocase subunit SecD, partial [Chromohalobacter japonicus]
MLNRYPLWKYLLILIVLLVGIIYALPNLYPADPAVQISSTASGTALDQERLDRLTQALEDEGIDIKQSELDGNSALIRLDEADQQIAARDILDDRLGDAYTVALNLADSTPDWLASLSATPMKLGLDLQGGVHFLLQVDMDAAVQQRLEANASAVRDILRDERIRYRDTEIGDRTITFQFASEDDRNAARGLIADQFPDFDY